MAKRALPSRDILNQLLRYEPETGKLFWRERPLSLFKATKYSAERSSKAWNADNAHQEAFTICVDGYWHGSIFGVRYKAHRVIWKMTTGEEPDEIDHINGDPSDNRFANLRDTTRSENLKNMRTPADNTSGVLGVCWHSQAGKWRAYLKVDGRQKHLGLFEDFDAAVAARKSAERKYGYHPNHGRKRKAA